MKIIKLLYFKYILSFLICIISSIVIFFIFSLLGNLSEDYLFKIIINLSLLNSFQILTYVPSFIFLLSVMLFTIFLRSKNEMIIIKSYMNIKRLMLFFLPIVLIFTILEINKNRLVDFIEDKKTLLIKESDKIASKILINEKNGSRTFTILKNINFKLLQDAEYRTYEIYNDKIQLAQFSNNLIISNNTLIANNYTQYKNDLIEDLNVKKIINIDLNNLDKQSSISQNISDKRRFELNIQFINLLIFYILFYSFIFLVFSSKRFVSIKVGLTYPIFICFISLLYSFLIFNNSINFYKQEFEIIASFIIAMFILKEGLNE